MPPPDLCERCGLYAPWSDRRACAICLVTQALDPAWRTGYQPTAGATDAPAALDGCLDVSGFDGAYSSEASEAQRPRTLAGRRARAEARSRARVPAFRTIGRQRRGGG